MLELWDVLDENGNKVGRLHERGKPMKKGDHHLVVHIWIMNSKNEFLLSRRAQDRGYKWHTTGGAAIAGDDSLTTALKEVHEELGINLVPENGRLINRSYLPRFHDEGTFICDVWLFLQEVDLKDVVLQLDEVCDVMWADKSQITQLIESGIFVSVPHWYPYLDEIYKLGPSR